MTPIFKRGKISRQYLAVMVCVLFIGTALTAVTGTSLVANRVSKQQGTQQSQVMLESDQNTLSFVVTFGQPTLTEKKFYGDRYTTIALPGTLSIGEYAGAPTLPVKTFKVLLPPQTTVKEISILGEPREFLQESCILQAHPIIPYQNPIVLGEEAPLEIDIDTELYTRDALFPTDLVKEYQVGYSHGYTLCSVSLHPVQYNPVQGKVWIYNEMTVEILLDEAESNPFYRNMPEDREWVSSLVMNPEMVASYTPLELPGRGYPGGICDPEDDFDYVIITTTHEGLDHWVAGGATPYNWTSLMQKHELDDGLACTLVTIQEIDVHPDYQDPDPLYDDLQAHIREFCKDAYQDWGTQYIFIGGDDEWIPARHMKYDYEGNVDSDIYWSNLDYTFNDDHDTLWGEEGDPGFDLYAELFIGRITCDVPQDVSNWMKKSFYYTDSTFQDYLDNAAFYGGVLGWNCQGDDFIDYSAIKGTDDWLGPIPGAHGEYPSWLGFQYGFETWNANNPGMEYDLSVKWTGESPNPGWQGGSESAAIAGLKDAINNNLATLISGVAHANEDMSLDVGMSTWEGQYHNTEPFFIHDFGCHCGDMDAADDGVLHSMLFHSDTELAFACVYNTCYGWGSFDDTNSSSALQMKSWWDYFFDTLNNSGSTHNWQMGKAMAWSKDTMAPTIDWTYTGAPGSWRGVIEGCLLFGDPAQKIKPPVQPDHNIGVQTLDVSSHEPADEDIWVGATLYNNGQNDETDVEVSFLVDGFVQDSTTIPFFAQGSVEEVGWWYHTPTQGWETHCVNVTPVPNEDILYDNERCKDVIYGPDIAVTEIQAPEYLGQGFPQDIKGYIQNLGPTDELVTIEFIANELLQETTDIFLTSGENAWVTFSWDGVDSGLGTYDVTIHAVPVPNEYYLQNQEKSAEVTVFAAIGNILLVDDDDGDAYESWYETALLASNYVYEIWDRSGQGSPSPGVMQGYTAVIWFTGMDYGSTLDATDQANLATFLDNGGKLFVSGQDIGYDIGGSSFYSNYFHATYLVDTAGYSIEGEPGDVIGDGLSFAIEGGDGASNQEWPDGIAVNTPAVTIFSYSDSPSHDGGLRVEEGAHRLVYLSFGFEGIDSQEDRTTVMTRILGWLAAEHDLAVTGLDVPAQVTQGEGTDVYATIMNGGINDETDIIVDFTVDGFVEDTIEIAELSAGQATEVMFFWNPTVGMYEVGVEVHPVPGEEILSNNAQYAMVEVIPAPQDDVGVSEILHPSDEAYSAWHTVEALVSNYGDLSQEDVLVNCSIYSGWVGTYFDEDFSGSFPPPGWSQEQTGEWEQSSTNAAGGISPEARLNWYDISGDYAYLQSAPVNTIGGITLTLEFKHFIDHYSSSFNCRVLTRADGADSWTDVTPWSNPVGSDIGPEMHSLDISHDIGEATQIRFEFDGYYWNLDDWYLDDVMLSSSATKDGGDLIYSAETYVDVLAHDDVVTSFSPPWFADEGSYLLEVTTLLVGDEHPENDLVSTAILILPAVLGDTNGDGLVNVEDLLTVLAQWGTTGPEGDVNFDNTVNVEDLLIVLANWTT